MIVFYVELVMFVLGYWMYLLEELLAEGVTTTIRLLLVHPFTVLQTRMCADLSAGYPGYNSYIYSIVNVVRSEFIAFLY